MTSSVPFPGHMVTGIAMDCMTGAFARFRQLALVQRNAADAGSWHGGCKYPGIMKNTFFAIIAVLATASFTQASELQPKAAVQYTVTAERIDFMVKRLGAVAKEEIARSLAQPIPASAIADANAKSKSDGQVAIAKDAKKAAELVSNHS